VIDLVDLILQPLITVMNGLFKFVGSVLQVSLPLPLPFCILNYINQGLKAMLTEELDVPFLGTLYHFIAGLMGEDEQFTAVNAISIVLAFPIAIIVGISSGGTLMDLDDTAVKLDDSLVWTSLFGPAIPVVIRPSAVSRVRFCCVVFFYCYYLAFYFGILQMRLAREASAAAPEIHSPAAIYSQVGSLIGAITGFANSVINLWASAGSIPKFVDKINITMMVLKQAVTFPIRANDQDEASWACKVFSTSFILTYLAYVIYLSFLFYFNLFIFLQVTIWVLKSLWVLVRNVGFKVLKIDSGPYAKPIAVCAIILNAVTLGLAITADSIALANKPSTNAGLVLAGDILSNGGTIVQNALVLSPGKEYAVLGTGVCFAGAIVALINGLVALTKKDNFIFQWADVGGGTS
jgi:hypothetical protein